MYFQVATENRQLWSRLSDLTKEKNKTKKPVADNSTNQNLIRSKTFTQHSPSPLLRQKQMPGDSNKSPDDLSLEEVSLKVLNDFMDVKAEIEKKCEEFNGSDCNSLGFGYLNDETTDGDVTMEAKKCNDGMHDIKNELLKQQGDLKLVLATLGKKQGKICMFLQYILSLPIYLRIFPDFFLFRFLSSAVIVSRIS